MRRPADLGSFEFVVLAGLRASQLARGCTALVEPSAKVAVTAQREVAERKVERVATAPDRPVSSR